VGRPRLRARGALRAIGDPPLVARSLNRVGNWHVNREEPHAGIPHHDEALAIFERAGDRRGIAETVDLLAMAHHMAGEQELAGQLYERAIVLFTELGDRRGLTNALAVLAICGPSHHTSVGRVQVSVHAHELLVEERAVRLATEIGWRAGEAFSRWVLADCLAWRGEYDRALRLARESLAIAEELEHREWQCGARRVLGVIALDLCATGEALAQFEAAHDIARRLASAAWIRWTGASLAVALTRAGEHARAAAVLDQVDRAVPTSPAAADATGTVGRTLGERQMSLARAEGALAAGDPHVALTAVAERDVVGAPRAALLRAHALAARERWEEASAALGTAREEALRQGARALLWRIDAAQGEVHLGERRRLDARRAFDAARATAADLESGLDEPTLMAAFRAGVDLLAPPPPERTPQQAARDAFGGLTRREREAAALVAQGKSNRAIARVLGIGERTVEGYVASALAKLRFSSRAQLAVWAAEQGLAAPEPTPGRPRR
jgi:DNA-binding CsgD family transcriptional regulator